MTPIAPHIEAIDQRVFGASGRRTSQHCRDSKHSIGCDSLLLPLPGASPPSRTRTDSTRPGNPLQKDRLSPRPVSCAERSASTPGCSQSHNAGRDPRSCHVAPRCFCWSPCIGTHGVAHGGCHVDFDEHPHPWKRPSRTVVAALENNGRCRPCVVSYTWTHRDATVVCQRTRDTHESLGIRLRTSAARGNGQ